MRNKLNDVYGLVINKEVDILVLGETWLNEDECKYYSLPNFECVFNCRENTIGGGTAVYVKKDFQFKTIETCKQYNKIIIEVSFQQRNVKLMTMYRPPSSVVNDFIEVLEKSFLEHRNMLFVGDVNIDILKRGNSNYMNVIQSIGFRFLNLISEQFATRKTLTSGTIIDHVLTNLPYSVFDSQPVEIIETSISDHNALGIKYLISNKIKCEMIFKEFTRIDYTKFELDVYSKINNKEDATIEDVIEILRTSKLNSTITLKKQVRKDSYRWMTLSILEMMEKKRQFIQEMEEKTK